MRDYRKYKSGQRPAASGQEPQPYSVLSVDSKGTYYRPFNYLIVAGPFTNRKRRHLRAAIKFDSDSDFELNSIHLAARNSPRIRLQCLDIITSDPFTVPVHLEPFELWPPKTFKAGAAFRIEAALDENIGRKRPFLCVSLLGRKVFSNVPKEEGTHG